MARLGFYYLKCTQRLVLQSRKKWNLTHINHVLFSQRAVCSELGGHRGNWRRRASDCLSVFRSDTEPSPHRVSVRGPNQTCITPHSNQLRALSGWDITAASQVWSMFWLFLEGWWFGSLRTLCLFFLSKKKKGEHRNTERSARILFLHTGECESWLPAPLHCLRSLLLTRHSYVNAGQLVWQYHTVMVNELNWDCGRMCCSKNIQTVSQQRTVKNGKYMYMATVINTWRSSSANQFWTLVLYK